MKYRRLGRSGLRVSSVSLGTMTFGGTLDDRASFLLLDRALEGGINFLDLSEMADGLAKNVRVTYGESEALLGRWLKRRRNRDSLIITTKVCGPNDAVGNLVPHIRSGNTALDRFHIERAIEGSLKRLGTDYVDLYQLHSPKSEPIEETMGQLVRLRDAGKIRYIGISNFSAEQTREALEFGPIHSSQPRYNMLYRQAEKSVLPFCLESGIGVMPHSVLAKGLLTGRYRPAHEFPEDDERRGRIGFYGDSLQATFEVTERLKAWAEDHGRDLVQLAIAWTLAHPSVTSPIVGAKSPEQARHNAKAADWRLTEADLNEIDAIQGDVRIV